jgi:hypothetical protein
VFDVHHKPHGLISLPSCHLSQVIKFNINQERNSVGDTTKFGAKTSNGTASGAPDTVQCPGQALRELATLRFTEGRSAIIHPTVRYAPDSVRYAPDSVR